MLLFDVQEFQQRIRKTKQLMNKEGMDILFITDPANKNYLSDYNRWSSYVHQILMVLIDEVAVWSIEITKEREGARCIR